MHPKGHNNTSKPKKTSRRKETQHQHNVVAGHPRSSTSSAKVKLISNLLNLPRELRDQIFDYALRARQGFIELPLRKAETRLVPRDQQKSVDAKNDLATRLQWNTRVCIRTYMALSRTCRQIGHEIRVCFFGVNTFAFRTCVCRKMSPFSAMDGMLKHMKRVTICQSFFHPNVEAVQKRDLCCVVELCIIGKDLQVEVAMSAKGSLRSARMERGGLRTCYPKYENQHQAAAVEIRPAIDHLGKSVQDGGSFSATALADIAGRMARASWKNDHC
ncbi:hypothetical protein LTR56_002858 [Elasticomyces elasticus]|nr:hypothetical protein LTR56_002858 [Elasticomyces elasticus]KAK3666685.1 hypothetical protein LTR22_002272 [Elasticomyces elasticus]KAK4920473.1 hypothetical protein LTR49_012065 [Elasticomyces elasticus]KAK5759240.1 hypothetical protein LTS12_010563 [Elasticomyces elasticus]